MKEIRILTLDKVDSPHDAPDPTEDEDCRRDLNQADQDANEEGFALLVVAIFSGAAKEDGHGGNEGPKSRQEEVEEAAGNGNEERHAGY